MGKVGKHKKSHRFNPLARGQASSGTQAEEAPKVLNAHQQRHLERKRLQAEAQALKQQKGKVSKANKFEHKAQKKALAKSIHALKAEAAALKQKGATKGKPAAESNASPAFQFSLPSVGASPSAWPNPTGAQSLRDVAMA